MEKDMIEEQMEISLENILPSLAESLYGNDWRISIRELLQNCNDANIEAQISDRSLPNSSLIIRIICNREQGTLIIQDEGIGMTLDEVKKYLGTIGYGKKRERLLDIAHDPEGQYNLVKRIIGQYGIGFLASFIVAEKVEVITKSRNKKEPPQKCIFSGETRWYHTELAEDVQPGTIVILYLKKKYRTPQGDVDLLNPAVLEEVVSKFTDILPYPIYRCEKLNEEGGHLLNCTEPPWERDNIFLKDLGEFFSRRFPHNDKPITLETFELSKDKQKIEAKGIIYFASSSFPRESSVNNELFVKRIFIRDQFTELLPSWMNFVGVIIDCPELTPTLDRNNVITFDQAFAHLKLALTDLIINKLIEYATNKKDLFNKLLKANLISLQVALLEDWGAREEGKEHFFRNIINYMPFNVISQDYPRGEYMTLMDYRQKFSISLKSQSDLAVGPHPKDPIYYLHEPRAHIQYETLVRKKNIPVISANFEREYHLIKAYGQAFNEEVDIRNIKTVLDDVYFRARIDQEPWAPLINFYTQMPGGPQMVKVASFEPNSMPGVLAITDLDKRRAIQLEEYISAGASILTPQLRRSMEAEVKKIKRGEAAFAFYINAKNRLMDSIRRAIVEEGNPPEELSDLLEEVYHIALVYANASSETEEHIFEHRTKLLENLLIESKDMKKIQANYDRDLIELKRLRELDRFHQQYCVDVSFIPVDPETRYGVVLIADLTKSTWILANIDFAQRGDLFNRYITKMKALVEKHDGFFDKFTGDGLLAFFGLKDPERADKRKICLKANLCATEIDSATTEFFGQEDVRKILRKEGLPQPKSRIALAAGEFAFGRFGGIGTAVGVPVVQVARLVSHKDFFKKNVKIVCTEQFITDIEIDISHVQNLLLQNDFAVEGSFPINVYSGP